MTSYMFLQAVFNILSCAYIESFLIAKKNVYKPNYHLPILGKGSELVELRGLVDDVRTAFEQGHDTTIYFPVLYITQAVYRS